MNQVHALILLVNQYLEWESGTPLPLSQDKNLEQLLFLTNKRLERQCTTPRVPLEGSALHLYQSISDHLVGE